MGTLEPAWVSKNKKIALNAVRKETDPIKLLEIAKNAPQYLVRKEAVKELIGQNILADIAKNDKDGRTRFWAAEGLSDKVLAQEIFADIAKNHGLEHWCFEVVECLTNQKVLADIAKNGPYKEIREEAFRKLIDLWDPWDPNNDDDDDVCEVFRFNSLSRRRQAIKNVTDQTLLAHIVKDGSSTQNMRLIAVAGLVDQILLADIAKNHKDGRTRILAAEGLSDKVFAQEILADIAKSDEDGDARLHAAGKLSDKVFAQEIFAAIAKSHDYWIISRLVAIRSLVDQTLLADIAKSDEDGDARLAAAEGLSDKVLAQEIFADIAKSHEDWHTRLHAAKRLSDKVLAQEIFADVAKNHDVRDLCLGFVDLFPRKIIHR